MKKLFFILALLFAGPVAAQRFVSTLPVVCNPNNPTDCVRATLTTSRADQVTIPLTTPNGILATAQTLASGACTTPQTVTISATYGLVYIITGTSPSLTLQSLGPDNITYMPGPIVTATGSQVVPIFAGPSGLTTRWCNTGANVVTITSSLTS
jgi:hypothetical protein